MKKLLLAGVAVLLMATSAAHAAEKMTAQGTLGKMVCSFIINWWGKPSVLGIFARM
jgi:hypothetical protein